MVEQKQKQKVSKVIIALVVTFVVCFGLWVKAYSAGAIATPPAVLVFGPPKITSKSEVPLRIVAMNALKRQRLAVVGFGLLNGDGQIVGEQQGDFGRLSVGNVNQNEKNILELRFKEAELSLNVPISLDGKASRSFDGFRWNGLEADYAAQLSYEEMSFYPLWGSVSSSLNNIGFFLDDDEVRSVSIGTNPASVFDPAGLKLVLDRNGYGIQGPTRVTPGSKVSYSVRSHDPSNYFGHAWLNGDLVDMKQLNVADDKVSLSFEVPSNAQIGDVFWVSVTQSPWLDVQGKAFVSRVSAEEGTGLKEHLMWLDSKSNGVISKDKLFNWLQRHEKVENQEGILQALHSRLTPPFYQAPIMNALPKIQMAEFEQRKAEQLRVWRLPFRVSAFILCLLALFWVRQEVARHLFWKSEMMDFSEDLLDHEMNPKTWKDKVPWHNLWGLMAFLLICGLFWGADWVLGLTLNDYQF